MDARPHLQLGQVLGSVRADHTRGGSLAGPMALNPVVFTEKVLQSFLRYQLRAYPFADPHLHGQMRELLSLDEARRSPLLQGPFVSLSRPFRGGAAVANLAAEGLLHPHLEQRIPSAVSRLYRHQEKAIRAIVGGRSTLVSTGTGSGKTECFLYPIVSRCLRLRDEGAPAGISAVIVYPMNALAEDQLMRLRSLLAGTGVSFGMYVGKTPEREKATWAASGFLRGLPARTTRRSSRPYGRPRAARACSRPKRPARGKRCVRDRLSPERRAARAATAARTAAEARGSHRPGDHGGRDPGVADPGRRGAQRWPASATASGPRLRARHPRRGRVLSARDGRAAAVAGCGGRDRPRREGAGGTLVGATPPTSRAVLMLR